MCWSVLNKRDVARDKAIKVSRGQTMINLVGHITKFGLYSKSNGRALKKF